jgi:predicted nucleic acid-binding protein
MLDTNVLLAATDEGRPAHRQALTVCNDWPGPHATLYTSAQILRGYLAVATRPAEHNGAVLTHGIDRVRTMNLDDFACFARYVNLVRL